jgi:hypothetical protein
VLVCCQSAAARRGAFLAEIDGNLIYKKDDSAIELHWQGKFRGPDFAPGRSPTSD